VVALLAVWAVLSTTVLRVSDGVPTPWAVVRQLFTDGWSFYQPHIEQTGSAALRGYLGGNLIALAAALVVLLIPPLSRIVMQLAIASYCLPLIAVGPVLSLLFDADTTRVALAGLSVVFTTLVGALLGLRSADKSTVDVVRAYGGGRWQEIRRVRLVAALPSILAALKIAGPAALLGAIIGEYLGRVDSGFGVAMTVSEQQLNVARTWGIALVAGALAGLAYGLVALIARFAVPWARNTTVSGAP
jgi:ABC-type nitrate/sulfonate/bicarbonate transport system permease component